MTRLHYLMIVLLFVTGCTRSVQISITNHADIPISKIEAIELAELNFNEIGMDSHLEVSDEQANNILSQLVDNNADSIADRLLIQVSVPAKSTVRYVLSISEKPSLKDQRKRTYARFVPERMDDFAWENDKVAFRAYGPDCQERFERGEYGLISSGIDCWLKRVEYPIINKWYKKEQQGGSYHKDEGEGLDNFNVGISRGCGGTAIRYNGAFICSENFAQWEVLTNGPLRSVFRLKYNPVLVQGTPVAETKTFTIDLGDHFYRCDVELESSLSVDTLAIGLTLHDKLGRTDCS